MKSRENSKLILYFILILTEITPEITIKIRNTLRNVMKIKNPDEVMSDSNGGDGADFVRRNRPPEHVVIPLINSLEAEYTPLIDIRKNSKEIIVEENLKLKRLENKSKYFNAIKNLISDLN